MRVNLKLNDDLVATVDNIAASLSVSRTALFSIALTRFVNDFKKGGSPFSPSRSIPVASDSESQGR